MPDGTTSKRPRVEGLWLRELDLGANPSISPEGLVRFCDRANRMPTPSGAPSRQPRPSIHFGECAWGAAGLRTLERAATTVRGRVRRGGGAGLRGQGALRCPEVELLELLGQADCGEPGVSILEAAHFD
jgi:hypothetical protein